MGISHLQLLWLGESTPLRKKKILFAAAFLVCTCALLMLVTGLTSELPHMGSQVALLGTWEEPHGIGIDQEPWSAPKNLWLYWGSTTNRRMTGSGEKIRHIFKMGNIEGGEWRDPKFLRSLEGSLFRRMSQRCCITMLFPPFEWDFPIYNPSKSIAQRIRSFVANGNAMVFTGGTLDFEFINRYFFYQLEPSDGNYSPGPFPLLPDWQGITPAQKAYLKPTPRILPQKGISVTAIKKESLPQVRFSVSFPLLSSSAEFLFTNAILIQIYKLSGEHSHLRKPAQHSRIPHQVLHGREPDERAFSHVPARESVAKGLPCER